MINVFYISIYNSCLTLQTIVSTPCRNQIVMLLSRLNLHTCQMQYSSTVLWPRSLSNQKTTHVPLASLHLSEISTVNISICNLSRKRQKRSMWKIRLPHLNAPTIKKHFWCWAKTSLISIRRKHNIDSFLITWWPWIGMETSAIGWPPWFITFWYLLISKQLYRLMDCALTWFLQIQMYQKCNQSRWPSGFYGHHVMRNSSIHAAISKVPQSWKF